MGRISQLPRAAITLDKPILEEPATLPETYSGASRTPTGIVTTRMFLQEFTTLSELVNDNNFMFYGPRERLTSGRLLDCYNKYQAWYRRLPPALAIDSKQPTEPHILVLQFVTSGPFKITYANFFQHAVPYDHCPSFPPILKSRPNAFRSSPARCLCASCQ